VRDEGFGYSYVGIWVFFAHSWVSRHERNFYRLLTKDCDQSKAKRRKGKQNNISRDQL
jgi:hypothetical protein